jgi:HSP20 family protein
MPTDLTRFNPFDDMRHMQRWMDRWWGPRISREDVELTTFDDALAVDVFEKDGNLVVKAALPGVDPKDIDVNVTDGVLYIKAETKSETDVKEGDWHRQEFRYGKYARSFRMPPDIDTTRAVAKYENGMLRLTFPRTEAAKPRSIHVDVR